MFRGNHVFCGALTLGLASWCMADSLPKGLIGCLVPYTVVTTPNPKLSRTVLAILPTSQNLTPAQYLSLGKFAAGQWSAIPSEERRPRWQEFQSFVFTDRKLAQKFYAYQSKRHGQALSDKDYANLKACWSKVAACYVYRNGRELVYFPGQHPGDWWKRKPAEPRSKSSSHTSS